MHNLARCSLCAVEFGGERRGHESTFGNSGVMPMQWVAPFYGLDIVLQQPMGLLHVRIFQYTSFSNCHTPLLPGLLVGWQSEVGGGWHRYEEAVRHFSECIRLDPACEVYYSNRAAAYTSMKQYTEALADAKEAVRLSPSWARSWARLGAAYFGLKLYAEVGVWPPCGC